jgi:hypothetical protein
MRPVVLSSSDMLPETKGTNPIGLLESVLDEAFMGCSQCNLGRFAFVPSHESFGLRTGFADNDVTTMVQHLEGQFHGKTLETVKLNDTLSSLV